MIYNSQKTISYNTTTAYFQLQLGSDGKIYASQNEPTLSVINKPNFSGISSNFTSNSLVVSGYPTLGLPQVIWGFKTAQTQQNITPVDTLCEAIVPNVITPNGDHINDEFKITCNKRVYIPLDLIIYNRWGQQVYNETKKLNHLNYCPDGTYFYLFTLNDTTYKGFVSVLH